MDIVKKNNNSIVLSFQHFGCSPTEVPWSEQLMEDIYAIAADQCQKHKIVAAK
jgi:hypothetical protein